MLCIKQACFYKWNLQLLPVFEDIPVVYVKPHFTETNMISNT